MAPTSTLAQEKCPTDPCPSSTHPKIIQCITFAYDLGAFQTAASVPGLRKRTAWVSCSPLTLPDISLSGLQNQMLYGFHYLVQVLQARAQTLRSLGTTSAVVTPTYGGYPTPAPLMSHCVRSGE